MREDHPSEILFSAGFIMIGMSIASAYIVQTIASSHLSSSKIIDPSELWFWGAISGYLIGLGISVWKYEFHFFETVDASALGIFTWIVVTLIANTIVNPSVVNIVSTLVCSLFILFYAFLNKIYKKLSWYTSGKVGFSGFVALGTFFLLRGVVALSSLPVLSFAGRIDTILSASFAFLLFLGVYNLKESI